MRAFSSSASSSSSASASSASSDTVFKEIVISSISVATATACTNPIDVIKVKQQTQQARNRLNVMKTAFDVQKNHGLRGFYVGLSPSLLRAATYGGLRLGLVEPIKNGVQGLLRLDDDDDDCDYDFVVKAFAGASSGAIAATLLNPSELVKTRMMKGDSFKVIYEKVIKKDGVRSLWRGCSMAATRAAILTSSQVVAYGEVKKRLIRYFPNDDGTEEDTFAVHFGASAIAGVVTTAATNPVDVIKTRMFIASETKALSAANALREVLNEFGFVRGALRGFAANYIRLGPQTMVTFIVAEELRKIVGLHSLK